MGKPEVKRSHEISTLCWEDNIKIDLQELEWGHGLELSGSG